MMAGNPSWWWSSMHPPNYHHQSFNTLLSSSSSSPSLFPSQYVLGSSSSFPVNSLPDSQEHPQSWSQLLLAGFPGEDDRFGTTPSTHYQPKMFENWEDHHHHHHQITNQSSPSVSVLDVKREEVPQTNDLYIHGVEEFHQSAAAWPQIMPPVSPIRSCVTSLSSSNILDFSSTKPAADKHNQQHKDHSSECNSTATGGVSNKKARVQASSTQPPLKVRKEKLGDRITSLHQLVSPFGKTDTASVLLEAIGYIRFLQGQIEALSSPYLTTSSANMRNQHCVQDINAAFPEDLGQDDQSNKPKDLRSRGLCLVPVSCTQQVGSDNGADYWAPPALGGGF